MASSSVRFMLIVVLLDVLLLMVMGFTGGIDNPDATIGLYSNSLDGISGNGTDQFTTTNIDQGSQYLEKSFGDPIAGGKSMSSLFGARIKLATDSTCVDCPDEASYNLVKNTVIWFMALLNVLMFVQLYMVIVNKKQD